MSAPDQALIAMLRAALRTAADPQKAAPMQAYMKSTMPFLGVQKPARVRALKPAFQSLSLHDPAIWRATVMTLFREATYREERYAALDLLGRRAYRSWLDMSTLPLLEALIVEGAWWDIVDEVTTQRLGPLLRRRPEALAEVMRAWAQDGSLWKRRASILAQLKHKRGTDLGLLSDVVTPNLHDPDFFIRKAIGWALREFAKTDPGWVVHFVEEHLDAISKLSRREALRILWKDDQAMHLR